MITRSGVRAVGPVVRCGVVMLNAIVLVSVAMSGHSPAWAAPPG